MNVKVSPITQEIQRFLEFPSQDPGKGPDISLGKAKLFCYKNHPLVFGSLRKQSWPSEADSSPSQSSDPCAGAVWGAASTEAARSEDTARFPRR